MTVLVTGAAGFVGLALTEHLLARGETVVAADLSPLPERARRDFAALPGRCETARLDVTDAAAFTALATAHRPRAIAHLAALTPLGAVTAAEAQRLAAVNIGGALNAVVAAAACGAFLLHASSGAVFGAAAWDADPLHAGVRPAPESAYGITKFAAERLVATVAPGAGVAAAVVRLSTVFGRWEHATAARPVISPIARVTEAARAGRPVVIGDDPPRDHVYSVDVARGLASVIDRACAADAPLHLSGDWRWSVAEWCAGLERHFPGFSWRIDTADPAAVGAANARAPLETERLAALTDFRACFGMEEAMADYLAWLEGAAAGGPESPA